MHFIKKTIVKHLECLIWWAAMMVIFFLNVNDTQSSLCFFKRLGFSQCPGCGIIIPSVESDELAYLQEFTRDLPDDKLRLFISIYNGKRKKAETILICCLLGFICFAGIQRFVIGQMGMGILYLFTGGLCLIGTIVDVINHKSLAYEFNQKMAMESMVMVKGF